MLSLQSEQLLVQEARRAIQESLHRIEEQLTQPFYLLKPEIVKHEIDGKPIYVAFMAGKYNEIRAEGATIPEAIANFNKLFGR